MKTLYKTILSTNFKAFVSLLLLTSISYSIYAEEKSVTIRGDKESPTVLYLVPWKKTPRSVGNTDLNLGVENNLELSPISRSEIIRGVRYFKDLGYDTKSAKRVTKSNVIRAQ